MIYYLFVANAISDTRQRIPLMMAKAIAEPCCGMLRDRQRYSIDAVTMAINSVSVLMILLFCCCFVMQRYVHGIQSCKKNFKIIIEQIYNLVKMSIGMGISADEKFVKFFWRTTECR